MFDTMTSTKVLGAVCGSLLVFLLGNWAADSLYSMEGGHGGEESSSVHDFELRHGGLKIKCAIAAAHRIVRPDLRQLHGTMARGATFSL